MSDTSKDEPAVRPLNTHITDAEANAGITPLNTHITDVEQAAGDSGDGGTVTPDNTHITSEPK
ncbi:hypothetical protein [Streptomyces naganishii]|uniref:Uncharacterized protein n=1 Tax=Streptomyces naganishii JCM 4654 TaxID=1306179 RepID=A0A918Y5A5_9ACTN|nr:hypothetical protein [Streptomyces naganishii]GHD91609.1 hypothetical protein GCM10010508_41170 [Streptomyces naganishii JCM 4654]